VDLELQLSLSATSFLATVDAEAFVECFEYPIGK